MVYDVCRVIVFVGNPGLPPFLERKEKNKPYFLPSFDLLIIDLSFLYKPSFYLNQTNLSFIVLPLFFSLDNSCSFPLVVFT